MDIEKLKKLAQAATPGPWMRLFGERTVYDRMEDGCRGVAIVRADVCFTAKDADNLDFIAAANPAAVLELIEIAERTATPAGVTATEQQEPTFWKSQRKMIERALIGLRDGWGTRKDADDALAALATSPAAPAEQDDARDAALEEAAITCDALMLDYWNQYKDRAHKNYANPHCEGMSDGAAAIATAIRSLKSKPTMSTAPASEPARQDEGMPVSQEPKYGIRDNRLYNRASGEFIPADEPVFIFRARDKLAVDVLDYYRSRIGDPGHEEAVFKRSADFSEFASAHPDRMKWPDTAPASEPVRMSLREASENASAIVAAWPKWKQSNEAPASEPVTAKCETCGGSRVDPGGLPSCRDCTAPTRAEPVTPAWYVAPNGTTYRGSEAEPVMEADKFCDANCTWADHAVGCVRAEPVTSEGGAAHLARENNGTDCVAAQAGSELPGILQEICAMQAEHDGDDIMTLLKLDDLCKRARTALAKQSREGGV